MSDVVVAPHVNLLDPAFYVDPFDAYRWLRDEAPVYWDPVQRLWGVSRHDDVIAVETNGRRYSSAKGSRPHLDLSREQSMINLDDPDHQTQRNVVAPRFTPRAVRTHEEHVRDVVTEILDRVVPLGECEAVEAIASRLPAIVVGDLLGYPRDAWEQVRDWSEKVMHLSGQTSPTGPPHVFDRALLQAMEEFTAVTIPLVEDRRRAPRDDLLSVWATRPDWDTARVLDETLLVLNGGAETTRTVIGAMIRDLALRPEQRRLLLERPELLQTSAVEEFIRWVSPVLNMRRTVTEDHELHGESLREGDEVVLLYGAANRDPRVYDDPEQLDVTRAHGRHVAFGFGAHFCLGAHLARLEIRVMFEELLRRMPEWELVDPDEPRIVPSTFARAYDRVRIRFPIDPTPGRS